jgi:hypothetical protein
MSRMCPECLFEPYVEGKSHMYGGRATSGLVCYGPKIRMRAKTAATKAGDVVDVEIKKPLPPLVKPLEPGERVAKELAEAVAETTPKPEPKPKRKTKPELAREKFLSLGLGLRTGATIPAPDPTTAPARRSKPQRRRAGRSRRVRSDTP